MLTFFLDTARGAEQASLMPRRRVTIRWGLTLIAVSAISSCQLLAPRISYVVDVPAKLPHHLPVLVLARVDNPPRDSLVLRAYATASLFRMTGLAALGPHNEPLRTSLTIRAHERGPKPANVPYVVVYGPLPRRVTLTYMVDPTVREGNAHVGYTGRRSSYIDTLFALTSGRDILLLPAQHTERYRLQLQLVHKETWTSLSCLTRLPRRPGAGVVPSDIWVPHGRVPSAVEQFASTPLAFGDFVVDSVANQHTVVRVACLRGTPVAERARTATILRSTLDSIRHAFRRPLGSSYLIVALPDSPDHDVVLGSANAFGQARSLIPLTPHRIHDFAIDVVRAYTRMPPTAKRLRHREDYWALDAIEERLAWASTDLLDAGAPGKMFDQLLSGYCVYHLTSETPRPLRTFYNPSPPSLLEAQTVAPAFLGLLLGRASAAGHEVDEAWVIKRLFGEVGSSSLLSDFARLLPAPTLDSLRRMADGAPYVLVLARADSSFRSRAAPAVRRAVSDSLLIVATGMTAGYLENCGCKSTQAGGLPRRVALVGGLRRQGTPVLLFDAGNCFPGTSKVMATLDPLALEEQVFYLQSMTRMGYAATNLGTAELVNGPTLFRQIASRAGAPFVSANTFAGGQSLGLPLRTIDAGGVVVTCIGLYEPLPSSAVTPLAEARLDSVHWTDPLDVARGALPALRNRSDLLVVLGQLSPTTVRALCRLPCPPDVVITTTFSSLSQQVTPLTQYAPGVERSGFIENTLVLYTTVTRYGVTQATVYLDSGGRLAGSQWQDRWLDESVPEDAGERKRLQDFYAAVGRRPDMQHVANLPFQADSLRSHGRYAGAHACASCHREEYSQWMTTPHAMAFKTLLDRHRHYHPRCVACHTTGFGAPGGYSPAGSKADLAGVQCEVCHGPAWRHAVQPGVPALRVPDKQVCLACHTHEHSERFVYSERLSSVLHGPRARAAR